MSQIQVSLSDRWVILGATGTGKTTFVRQILWEYARATKGMLPIHIWDTKGHGLAKRGRDDFREFYQKSVGEIHREMSVPKIKLPRNQAPFLVWQPEFDDPDLQDEYLFQIYRAGIPSVIFFDELSSLDPKQNGKGFPRHFGILQKQGRGLDICTISITQAPVFIQQDLLRQVTHIVRFSLNTEDGEKNYDLQKLASKLGRKALQEPEDLHGFWYRNVTRPTRINPPIYYKDMGEFF